MKKSTRKKRTKVTTLDTIYSYNNKRVIVLAKYMSKHATTIIRIGFTELLRQCNKSQKDIHFELFDLEDDGFQIFGAMVDESCPFEDETIRGYLVTNLASMFGRLIDTPILVEHKE